MNKKIKTFRFNEFKSKLDEGFEEIGFNKYENKPLVELEDETRQESIDDLNPSEEVNIDSDEEPLPDMATENDDEIVTEPNKIDFSKISSSELNTKRTDISKMVNGMVKEFSIQDLSKFYDFLKTFKDYDNN